MRQNYARGGKEKEFYLLHSYHRIECRVVVVNYRAQFVDI